MRLLEVGLYKNIMEESCYTLIKMEEIRSLVFTGVQAFDSGVWRARND